VLLADGGFKKHGDAIERLLEQHPSTRFVLDHYAFIPCQSRAPEYSATMERAPEVSIVEVVPLFFVHWHHQNNARVRNKVRTRELSTSFVLCLRQVSFLLFFSRATRP